MEKTELLLKALADKNRLRIIGLLSHQDFCVCELVYALKITQPSVSKHLKKLKKSGLIDSKQDGAWTVYFLAPTLAKDEQKILNVILASLSKKPQLKVDIKSLQQSSRKELCC